MIQYLITGAAEGIAKGITSSLGLNIIIILIVMYIFYRLADSFPNLPVANSYRGFYEVFASVDGWLGYTTVTEEDSEENEKTE